MARLPATSSASGPSSNPPSSAPAASSSQPARKSGSSRPLQVPVQKAAGPVRHKPFSLGEQETTGSKFLSNQINNEGKPKAKACVQCLGSLAAVNESQVYGRGMNSHNEVFSCMILNSVGLGGIQCGRCVGLGKGNECSDPPAGAEKAARDVIALVPAYNKALLDNPKQQVEKMSDADKTAIRAAVNASKAFTGILSGLRKQDVFTTTPGKKRKLTDFASESKISDLNSALTRGQSGLESKLDSLIATVLQQGAQLQDMSDTLRRLNRRSIAARGRDRWLVNGVEEVAHQLNQIESHASVGRVADTPIDVNGVGDFDLTAIDLESDHESEAEEE